MNFKKKFEESVRSNWNKRLLGNLKNINIQLVKANDLVECSEFDTFPIKLMLSSLSAALSTKELLGMAENGTKATLKSVKNRMDTSASYAFYDYWKHDKNSLYISASEGKDERGSDVEDPLKLISREAIEDFGIAVDVVDGTTLAAKGVNGAYSIAGAARGLRTFTDMQAYTMGGPVEVLSKLDFANDPEKEVVHFVNLLKEYYRKEVSDLKIVTHSWDTGMHHSKLISIMKEMGVQVIIPNPVIVEPPYVASMALGLLDSPDGMIGVFGLPEVVINALLCAIISDDQELWFRIASNKMLTQPQQKDLGMAFSFSKQEEETLNSLGLDVFKVYKKKNIADNMKNACFVAVALTDDPILKFNGIKKNDNSIIMETLFSGYGGITLKMITEHEIYNDISYTARNHQNIDDISVIVPITKESSISYFNRLKEFIKANGFTNLQFVDDTGMHVTIYESGIHHGGYDGDVEENIKKLLLNLKRIDILPFKLTLSRPVLLKDAIVCEVGITEKVKNNLLDIPFSVESVTDFENVNKVPDFLHVTIARLTEYFDYGEWNQLRQIISEFPEPDKGTSEIVGELQIIHIKKTPYDEVMVVTQ